MLGGIAPIFIFTFFKNFGLTKKQLDIKLKQEAELAKIPVVAGDETDTSIPLPPIPLYLDEGLTGIYIDTESKNVDAETNSETLSDGSTIQTTQKAVNSTITINMFAKRDSIGLTILSAMMDIIYQKLTSREYQITYLHGTVTVFAGLLHSFSIQQSSENELCQISIVIVKNSNNTLPKTPITVITKTIGVNPTVSGT